MRTTFYSLKTIFFIIYLVTFEARADDFEVTPDLRQAYADIFKLKIQSGYQFVKKHQVAYNQSNGFVIYAQNFAETISVLVTDDYANYQKWKPNEDARLDLLDDLSGQSPYQRFLMAEVRLQWAFAKLKFGDEVSACWDIIKAYRLLDENARLFPQFLPTFKSLGLLHILIGATPENYRWVTNVLGLKGNIALGYRELEKVKNDPIWGKEAQLMTAMVQSNVQNETSKVTQLLVQLSKSEPDNLLLVFFVAQNAMKDNRCDLTLQWLDKRPKGPMYLNFVLLDFLKAEALTRQAKYAEAMVIFEDFMSRYKGYNFVKDTYFKLYLCDALRDNDARAQTYLSKILSSGHTVVESDKSAQKFAEKYQNKTLNVIEKQLLKARMAFDGGYFDKALELLMIYQEKDCKTISEKAEYHYRLGRIYQEKNQEEAAQTHFQQAIALSVPVQLHFGANAALQSGYVCLQQKNRTEAIARFKQALNYPKHEYKNSVDNKARAALSTLGVSSE